MSDRKPQGESHRTWALAGIPAAAVLCCGLPLLAGALGLTAAAGFLAAQRLWLFGGMVALMGAAMLLLSRRKGRSCEAGTSCDGKSATDSHVNAGSIERR